MPSHKRTLFLLTVVLAVSVSTTVSALRKRELYSPGPDPQKTRDQQQEADDDGIPTADFDAPEPGDPSERAKRRGKSAKYDDGVFVRKDDATGSAVESSYVSEWDVGLPALPAGKSEVVIIGAVSEAKAHLSNDKTGVYSEFTTCVEKVLKNSSPAALAPGGVISLERPGGAVRYSTGRRYRYLVSGQRMPRRGRRYVFFLNTTEEAQSFSIITAYELKGGIVFPLDSSDQFVAYKGMGEVEFIGAVQGAVSQN
jgi:hypothetical protein